MGSPEFGLSVSAVDKKDIEPRVKAVHEVPLVDLLEGENKNSPIAQDPVSIYSIGRLNGTEYAVVSPSLSGKEFNDRLCVISKVPADIVGVGIDFSIITRKMQSKLAKDHQAGLGHLWEVFFVFFTNSE